MKRCKFINEPEVQWFRYPLRDGGQTYSNPSAEQLDALGYFRLVDTPRGEESPDFVLLPSYRVEGNTVVRSWSYEPLAQLP